MDQLEAHACPAEQVNLIYFGPAWSDAMLRRARRVETPEGQDCFLCEEPIVENDRGLLRAVARLGSDEKPFGKIEPVHVECDYLPIIGHAVGVCFCNGFEPTRDAARLAWQRAKLDGMHL